MRFVFLLFYISSVFSYSTNAPQATVYRTYWLPQFHAERLNYCNEDKTHCGQSIANKYCRMLGYHHSSKFLKAPHLGVTNFISGKNACHGWTCSGFEWIECAGKRQYQSPPKAAYKEELFPYPRWHKFPLDYCYKGQKGCGKRAAYAYCRWQAYQKVKSFRMKNHVLASKKMSDNSLCFGNSCHGFEYIICQR